MSPPLDTWTQRHQHYVDGQWVDGGTDRITLVDPYTRQPFACAPMASAELVDQAAQLGARYRLGDPRDESTTMGPIATERHYERVRAYIRGGVQDGAQLVCGGEGPLPGLPEGWFIPPTVFVTDDPRMRIVQEEVFGPVLTVMGYRDADHAIELAKGTVHGLNGGVYAARDEDALRVAAQLRCGKVDINGGVYNINAPAGGYKQSGIGRERGHYAIDEYQEVKALQFNSEEAARHFMQRIAVGDRPW